jgi:hypothetical protein
MGKRFTTGLAIFALFVVPLAAYLAGYLLLPETVYWCDGNPIMVIGYEEYRIFMDDAEISQVDMVERIYPQQWQRTIYKPAATVEGWLCGVPVQPTWGQSLLTRFDNSWELPDR